MSESDSEFVTPPTSIEIPRGSPNPASSFAHSQNLPPPPLEMANNDTGSSSRTFPPDDSNHEEIAVDFVIEGSTNELRGPGGNYLSMYTTRVKKQEPWRNVRRIVWNGIGEMQDGGLRVPPYIRDGKYDILVERALEGSDEVGWKPYLLFEEDYDKVFGDFSLNSKIVIGIVEKQVAAQTTTQTTDSSSRNSLPHESNQEDAEGITVDLVVENSTNELRGPGGKYISRYTTRVKKQEPWTNVRRIVWGGFGELERRGLLPLYIRDGKYDILVERALEGSDEVEWKSAFIFAEDYHKVFGDFSSNSKTVIGIVQKQVAAQTTTQTRTARQLNPILDFLNRNVLGALKAFGFQHVQLAHHAARFLNEPSCASIAIAIFCGGGFASLLAFPPPPTVSKWMVGGAYTVGNIIFAFLQMYPNKYFFWK